MKIIRYQIATEINRGTEEHPSIEVLLQEKIMAWSESSEAVAKKEAYNGKYEIVDDNQPESEPTELEKLRADLDFLSVMTGVSL